MTIEDNIKRISEKLSQECQDASREFANQAVGANPKLVKNYIMGKSALSMLVDWATQASNGIIDPTLTGEWCVVFLEAERVKLRILARGR